MDQELSKYKQEHEKISEATKGKDPSEYFFFFFFFFFFFDFFLSSIIKFIS